MKMQIFKALGKHFWHWLDVQQEKLGIK